MKKIILSILAISCLYFPADTVFAEAASSLKPQLIEGIWQSGQLQAAYVYRNGKYILYPGEASFYQAGDQKFKGTFTVNISFYNVGNQSSNKEHFKATLTITTKALEAGDIITQPSTFREDPRLGARWTNYTEPAGSMPPEQVETKEYTFTGGINGVFVPVDSNETIKMQMEQSGSNLYVALTGGKNLKIDVSKYLSAFLETADSGARFSGITGVVEMRLPGDCARCWHAVKLDTVIPVGAHIRTEDDSAFVISFKDLSAFVIKENSEIIIEAPPTKEEAERMSVIKGNVWTNVKEMFRTGSMEIEMTQVVAGIKGTTLILEETGDKSTVKVIEGVVNLKSKTTDESIDIGAGQTAYGDANGLSELIAFDATVETEEWDSFKQKIESGTVETTDVSDTGGTVSKYWYLLLILIPVGATIWFILKIQSHEK